MALDASRERCGAVPLKLRRRTGRIHLRCGTALTLDSPPLNKTGPIFGLASAACCFENTTASPDHVSKGACSSLINAGLADPALKARIGDLGYSVFASSRGAFGTFIADETDNWSKVMRIAHIEAA